MAARWEGDQDKGLDTVAANERLGFKADERDYGVGAQILFDLGVRRMRLLTNNPSKVEALRSLGVAVETRAASLIQPNRFSAGYLEAKRQRMGHALPRIDTATVRSRVGTDDAQ